MTTEYQRLGGRLPEEIEWQIREFYLPKHRKPLSPDLSKQIKLHTFTYRVFKENRYYKLCDFYNFKTTHIHDNIDSFSYGWWGPRGKHIHPVRCGKHCKSCYFHG